MDPFGVMITMSCLVEADGIERVRTGTSLPVEIRLLSSFRKDMVRRTNCSSSSRVEWAIKAFFASCCSTATSRSSTVIFDTSDAANISDFGSTFFPVKAGDFAPPAVLEVLPVIALIIAAKLGAWKISGLEPGGGADVLVFFGLMSFLSNPVALALAAKSSLGTRGC